MSDKSEPCLVEDFNGILKLYSDGSVVREAEPALPYQEMTESVLFQDVVFDDELGLWARLYLPPQTQTRVPVLLYFHGGGFCFVTAANPMIHSMCQLWAAKLGVIVVSVNYRLAPEHRLPAAYHDSIAALRWLQSMKRDGASADPWLHSHADFSKVFVGGESAGGNIAHHVGMWAAAAEMEIRVKGMILLYPYFGGEERTASERGRASAPSPVLTVEQSDILWRLALPVGSNRDHPFSNPLAEGGSNVALPSMLFVIGGKDILRDKQLQYCEALKKWGKQIKMVMFDEEDHGFTLLKTKDPSSVEVLRCISDFLK